MTSFEGLSLTIFGTEALLPLAKILGDATVVDLWYPVVIFHGKNHGKTMGDKLMKPVEPWGFLAGSAGFPSFFKKNA
jgi:hypothetical protein